MQRPDLEIYTKDFERVGIIDAFTSGQFERCLWEVGKMELHVSLLARYADQLKIGHIVMIDKDRAWEITAVKKSEAKHGLGLVVYGQELKGILRQRLVVPDEQDDNKHFGWDRVPTDKLDADPPSAPELDSKTDNAVALVAVPGMEYRMGSGDWQSGAVFGSLDPATEYSFYARTVETWSHNPSGPSAALVVTTDKGTQNVPDVPVMASRTGTSITLVACAGCEYRRDSGSWQDSVVFGGLSPVTSYTFYARRKETATHYASPESAGASIMTDKGEQTAPSAPTMESRTGYSITLAAITGCEYRISTGDWQDSRVFEGLSPVTAYTFYARKKETSSYFAGASSAGASLSTDKGTQTAPSAPTMASRTGSSITLNAIAGCEYRRGSGAWQDGLTFSGLSPVTNYAFYARKKETASHFASPDSPGASFATDKGTQTAPAAPTMASKTGTSVTLNVIAGCEYKRDGKGWQDSPEFTGLSPVTSYTFYARKKETDDFHPSPPSLGTTITTDKDNQATPSAPTMASRTGTSITLNIIIGCEYRRDDEDWQDSPEFTGLSPVTSYTFYARKKETPTLYPSPSSAGTSITTDKDNQTAPAAPTVSDIEHDSAKVTSVTGAEVRLGAGSWFDSPKLFEGLEAETEYTATARMKETVTHYASPISPGKAFETPSAPPPEGTWAWVQWHVRNGTHLTEFAVGDVFTCLYSGSPINVMIIGMDVETPTNSSYTHSMTLHTVDCLPVTFQFDSPESNNPDSNRKNYGNNRWRNSNIRQWLNSDASSYQWKATHIYDKAPSSGFLSGYSGGGFLKLLDPELVEVLGSVEKKTALCNYDGTDLQDTTTEKVFLLSRKEVGFIDEGNVSGEFAYPWYNSNARRVKKVGASNSYWWLRSPNVSDTYGVRSVYTGGAVGGYYASSAYGLAPACVII